MQNPFALLFEPVVIGPVTAKNRFYQVPHCNGAGDWAPQSVAAMRGMKAEGGWGVVCTENLMVDPWSDINPFPAVRLWDEDDAALQALSVEKIHLHGALAGCELAHFGMAASNRLSRNIPLGPSSRMTLESTDPMQCRRMDKADIRAFHRRHREAALRARRIGFDIIYLYCSHENSIFSQFFSPYLNDRQDEYGGSLSNRMRLFHEVLAETKEAVGDRCAIAIRFSVAQLQRRRLIEREELHDIIAATANMPDLWDVNINDWSHDSATSRFAPEGHQENLISFVKGVTEKPVVGVGRFTSPDTMLAQVRRGVLDFIGAARPSIADPFLPRKIAEGRVDEIRECIGCNICVMGENSFSMMRCTQNPTIMEEWRRGWHPEKVPRMKKPQSVLIVGSGPAGLEAALTLAKRGCEVVIAEAASEFGGRVRRESRLPGLAEWIRVRDYRLAHLSRMSNVALYRDSHLDADDLIGFGFENVVLATGARWRNDGVGRTHYAPIPALPEVLTPDDILDGKAVDGHVLLYDDDGGYLASALAEQLLSQGANVTIATPHEHFARWTRLTLEQGRLRSRLLECGVTIRTGLELLSGGRSCEFLDTTSNRTVSLAADYLLLVTSRYPDDALYQAILAKQAVFADAGIASVVRIGDCLAPGLIAHAIFAGHRLGRAFGQSEYDSDYRRERFSLSGQAVSPEMASHS